MSGYITLTRQMGLFQEMQSVANNLANMSTSGYRKEGLIFSEVIQRTDGPDGSVSMGAARVRNTNLDQGPLTHTSGQLDFAIEGPGFFQVETPDGVRMTRAGAFLANGAGELVTPDGHRVLDAGGAPIFIPPQAKSIGLADDGALSADGVPIAQIGLVQPLDLKSLTRDTGVLFKTHTGVEPVLNTNLLQGFVEGSNVDPVLEVTRMIEVQRSYEMGQSFQDKEGDRLSKLIRVLGESR